MVLIVAGHSSLEILAAWKSAFASSAVRDKASTNRITGPRDLGREVRFIHLTMVLRGSPSLRGKVVKNSCDLPQ
jgi:hypothetical protein